MIKYNIIYADPAWSYSNKKTGGSMTSGAETQYKVMTLEELKAMPVNEITADNALCFLWATVPLFPEGLAVLEAWGFQYKTMITWEKTGILGMGFWLRVQTEHLLIGVKGDVKPFAHQQPNIYRYKICKHSAKPHFFRELVMKLAAKSFDECTRLELFARSRAGMFSDYEYEGWSVWGNQVNNSIQLPKAS
jgi:N6-adenosine-specific RNA methylase IME4